MSMLAPGTRIAQARRTLAAAFRAAGLNSPELDARVLVGHVLALDHAALAAQADRPLDEAALDAIADVARRRLAREPVARILGWKEFWGLELSLNAETLVPRPETESLIETALRIVDALGPRDRPLRVADLGTGTGAILLALLSELPAASGIGTDIDPRALSAARANAGRHGLQARAAFVACDYGQALTGGFDLIVSNPPYVKRGDIAGLDPEVRDHDPWRALDGGPDGLGAYRALAADAPRLLRPDGTLIVELGAAAPALELFSHSGLTVEQPLERDLAGRERVLCARPRQRDALE